MLKKHQTILLAVLIDMTIMVTPGITATYYVWKSGTPHTYNCGNTICYTDDRGGDPWNDTGAFNKTSLHELGAALGGDDNVLVFSGGENGVTFTGTDIDNDGGMNLSSGDMTWRVVKDGDPQSTHHNGTVLIDGSASSTIVLRINDIDFIIDGFVFANASKAPALVIAEHESGHSVAIKNCTFENNGSSEVVNGAVSSDHSTEGLLNDLTIESCVFQSNHSINGAGAYIENLRNITITDSIFTHNTCNEDAGEGGGLKLHNLSGSASVSNCTFINNKSGVRGGGLFGQDIAGGITVANCLFENNEVNYNNKLDTGHGGGLFIRDNTDDDSGFTVNVTNCTFTGNKNLNDTLPFGRGGDGGGMKIKGLDSNDKINATISDCTFLDNHCNLGGGTHIGRFADPVSITRCRYKNNKAWHHGGAIVRGGASGDPAGIDNEGEIVTISYCEFIENLAGIDYDGNADAVDSEGGAIDVYAFPRAEIYNCSFYNNASVGAYLQKGDAVFVRTNTTDASDPNETRSTMKNCIFYGYGSNAEIDDNTEYQGYAFLEFSYNAFASGESLAYAGIEEGNIILTSDPFGGNLVLQEGSVCIGGGALIPGLHDQVQPAVDLSGKPVLWGPSIGAYEFFEDAVYADTETAGYGSADNPFSFDHYDGLMNGTNQAPLTIYVKGELGHIDLSGYVGPDNPVYTIRLWPDHDAYLGSVIHKGSEGSVDAWWETGDTPENDDDDTDPNPPNEEPGSAQPDEEPQSDGLDDTSEPASAIDSGTSGGCFIESLLP